MKRFFIAFLPLVVLCWNLSAETANEDKGIPFVFNESLDLALKNAMVLPQDDNNVLLASFLTSESDKFRGSDFAIMTKQLKAMSEPQLMAAIGANYKDPTTSLLLSIFVGGLGIDRFYVGDTGLGIAKLITLGGAGIWWIIDMFVISNRTKVKNYKEFVSVNANSKLLLE